MLVIRRKTGEAILIGEEVEIEVMEASPGRVKLGIRAPLEVPILRKEIKLTHDQNRAASVGVSGEEIARLVAELRHGRPAPVSSTD